MPQNPPPLPDFTRWPSFPFEGDLRVKHLAEPVAVEPPRSGEDAAECVACNTPDDAYIWASDRWRVRGMDRPTGLPIVLILECRSHLDIGDLPNLLAAELGVMTVRLERAIRSLDGVARVHVNRWGDGSAHLHMWFLARPYGRLQLRGTFLSLWDDILPVIPEEQWLENLALVAEWLAGFGGRAIAEPPHIHWQSPSTFGNDTTSTPDTIAYAAAVDSDTGSAYPVAAPAAHGDLASATDLESGSSADTIASRGDAASDLHAVSAETRDLSSYFNRPASTPSAANGDARAADELGGRGEGDGGGEGDSGEGDSGEGGSGESDRGRGDHDGPGTRNELGKGDPATNDGHQGGSQIGAAIREQDSEGVVGGGQTGEVDALSGTAELRLGGRLEDAAEPRVAAGLVGGIEPQEGAGDTESLEGAGLEGDTDSPGGAGLEGDTQSPGGAGSGTRSDSKEGARPEGGNEPRKAANLEGTPSRREAQDQQATPS